MKNKTLVITGMHRSGTSLVSQWLHKCGIHLGDQVLGPAIGNSEGHFEDVDFVHLHEDILQTHLLPHSGLMTQAVSKLTYAEIEAMESLILKKNSKQEEWAWKDPRTCLFLTHYRRLLPSAFYLVILRDYASVVSSLINRMYAQEVQKYMLKNIFTRWKWTEKKK